LKHINKTTLEKQIRVHEMIDKIIQGFDLIKGEMDNGNFQFEKSRPMILKGQINNNPLKKKTTKVIKVEDVFNKLVV